MLRRRDRLQAIMAAGVEGARPGVAVLAILLAALLAACAGDTRPAALMQAYVAVDAARSDRRVRALAPAGLYDAETALARAFRAWQAGEPELEVNGLADIAVQRAADARLDAVERLAEHRIEIVPAQAQPDASELWGQVRMTGASGPAVDGRDPLLLDAGAIGGATEAPAAGEPSVRRLGR